MSAFEFCELFLSLALHHDPFFTRSLSKHTRWLGGSVKQYTARLWPGGIVL